MTGPKVEQSPGSRMALSSTPVKSTRPVRVAMLAALLPTVAFAGSSPQKVWEVKPSEMLTNPAALSAAKGYPIVDLAFSPDGKKLAAAIYAGNERTHLLILDLQSPQAGFRQFDLETCGKFLAWAPDGGALLICGHVLRLNDGSSCDTVKKASSAVFRGLYNSSYWLTTDQVIQADRTVTDLSCQPAEAWRMTGNWYVAGTAAAKGWILLGQSIERTVNGRTLRFHDYAIADRDSHRLTSSMLLRDAYTDGNTIMAQGPAVFCSVLTPAGGYKPRLQCWKLPDGELLPLSSELRTYSVTQAACSSPRVVAQRWGYPFLDLWKEVPDMLSVIVVDLISGHRVASLRPRLQGDYSSVRSDQYFQYALSPSGELLAEGGGGSITLYRLQ